MRKINYSDKNLPLKEKLEKEINFVKQEYKKLSKKAYRKLNDRIISLKFKNPKSKFFNSSIKKINKEIKKKNFKLEKLNKYEEILKKTFRKVYFRQQEKLLKNQTHMENYELKIKNLENKMLNRLISKKPNFLKTQKN